MKEKKRILLEKVEKKKDIEGPRKRDRKWIERKQQSWRRFRENVNLEDDEKIEIFNKLMSKVRVREPKYETIKENLEEKNFKSMKLGEPKLKLYQTELTKEEIELECRSELGLKESEELGDIKTNKTYISSSLKIYSKN